MKFVLIVLIIFGVSSTLVRQSADWIFKLLVNNPNFLNHFNGVTELTSNWSKAAVPCSPGFVIISNPNHNPSSNGCSAGSFRKITGENALYNENQELCCSDHDICYNKCYTLSSNDADEYRSQCDLAFKNCLERTCYVDSWNEILFCPLLRFVFQESYWEEHCDNSKRNDNRKECKAAAEILYKTVEDVALTAYEHWQSRACGCIPEGEHWIWILLIYILVPVINIICHVTVIFGAFWVSHKWR